MKTSLFNFPYSSVYEVIDKFRLFNHDPMVRINFMQLASFMFKEVALPFLSPKCKCFLLATDKGYRNWREISWEHCSSQIKPRQYSILPEKVVGVTSSSGHLIKVLWIMFCCFAKSFTDPSTEFASNKEGKYEDPLIYDYY